MPLSPIVKEDIAAIAGADLPWATFQNSTVVISGAAGYLPSYMVETLLYLNDQNPGDSCQVVGLVRNLEKARRRFEHHADRPDLALTDQDICDRLLWAGAADFVIHAASQASPKYYGSDPVGTITANTLGTANLLRLARERGARGFLFFSSSEVYGRLPEGKTAMAEDDIGFVDPTDVRSCYAEGKRAGETLCVSYAKQHSIPCRIVRPFHTYGPGMALDDGRVFADFVANIVRGEDIALKSDGSARRAFCYLADAVTGFFTALLKGEAGRAYNVANPDGDLSIRELADLLVELFPEKTLKVVHAEGTITPGYIPSPVAACLPNIDRMAALGWRPSTNVRDGFLRTVKSYL